MSTKTTIRKIALVAVSALGLGLLSVIPANAAPLSAITAVTPAAVSSPSDTSIILLDTGSLGTRYSSATVYTDKTGVLMTDLKLTVAATYAAVDDTYDVTASPDGISTGSTLSNYAKVKTPDTTSATGGTTSTRPLSNFTTPAGTYSLTSGSTTLLVGTHYLYIQPTASTTYTATTAWKIQLTIANPTMTDVAPTITNSTGAIAGRIGQQISIPITSQNSLLSAGSGARPFQRYAAAITQQPTPPTGQSSVYPTLTAGSAAINSTLTRFDKSQSVSVGSTVAINTSVARGSTADATGPASILYTTTAASGTQVAAVTSDQTVGTLTFTPVSSGTYTVVVWAESSSTGYASLSGSESYKSLTINVAASVASVALTPIATAVPIKATGKGGVNGALIKVTLKDAAGNASTLAPGESVSIAPNNSGQVAGVNGSAVTSAVGATYNLASSDFNSAGVAWVNVTDTVAESSTITASVNGGTASSSTTITYKSSVAVAANPAISATATGVSGTVPAVNIPIGATSVAYRATASTGSYVSYAVKEAVSATLGVGTITGYTTALAYDVAVQGSTTLGYASLTVSATTGANAEDSYYVATDTGAGDTFYAVTANSNYEDTATAKTNTAGVLSVNPTSMNAVTGSTNSITATLKDLFRRAYASQAVSVSVAGKNATAAASTVYTDANGQVTYSLTDANANSAVTDTVTFTSGSAVSVSISYGVNAVNTITLTTDDTTASVANDTTSAQAIDTSYLGASNTTRTVTATVKNAAGALLAGVPVTFSVAGTGAAITSTTKTVYTGTAGTASASIYGWVSGTYTVTATAGGKSGTATESFYSTSSDSVRTVTAVANGNKVVATAKDRYGNPVANATLYAKVISGTGDIAGSLAPAGATTDLAGTVTWVVSNGAASVSVSNISFSSPAGTVVGQTGAAKGYDIGGSGATALTAYVAGTTTTAETGVGSTYDAAGVATATVDVAGSTQSSDAVDAANEATDAANAATDAANAAAEAADAATAAAQDAQAAVAALASQVADLIAGIKAQIASLTNLVIKIQKKVKA